MWQGTFMQGCRKRSTEEKNINLMWPHLKCKCWKKCRVYSGTKGFFSPCLWGFNVCIYVGRLVMFKVLLDDSSGWLEVYVWRRGHLLRFDWQLSQDNDASCCFVLMCSAIPSLCPAYQLSSLSECSSPSPVQLSHPCSSPLLPPALCHLCGGTRRGVAAGSLVSRAEA